MLRTELIYNKINVLRQRYYACAGGKQALLTLISEAEVAEQVYNSNAIENSTLSLEETEKILMQIDLERYISDREIFEAAAFFSGRYTRRLASRLYRGRAAQSGWVALFEQS